MTSPQADELTSRAQGRVGTVLRRKYRLDRVLGVGGMAVVYKATHRNEAEFAVKMLHPELSIREDIRSRFLREGKAANSVKHPGVVLVVDDDVAEDGAAFLVMELLNGAEVESLLERCRHRMPVRAVLSVADQLLDVLAAAHAKGIVHRDIKPANLFASSDGTLKVLDFGIARVKEAAASQGGGNATGTGILLGTPAFMAPEQAYAKASEIDGQTDVWAVGATLFTLLSGQFVHQGENASQLMIQAATARARPVSSVVPDLSPRVAEAIDRALAFEKSVRWPSAVAMREAIVQASLAAFGERPSKGALAALVTGGDPAHAQTERPPTSKEGTATSPPHAVLPGTGAMPPTQASGQGLPRPVGGTTAQPVSSEPMPSAVPGVPRRSRAGLLSGVAAGALLILAASGLVFMRGRVQAPVVAASPVPPVSAALTGTPSVVALDPTPGVAASSASVEPPAASSLSAGKPRSPPLHGATAPTAPVPAPKPSAAPSSSAPPAPPAPSKPKPNCDPAYTLDSNGEKHWKPECF